MPFPCASAVILSENDAFPCGAASSLGGQSLPTAVHGHLLLTLVRVRFCGYNNVQMAFSNAVQVGPSETACVRPSNAFEADSRGGILLSAATARLCREETQHRRVSTSVLCHICVLPHHRMAMVRSSQLIPALCALAMLQGIIEGVDLVDGSVGGLGRGAGTHQPPPCTASRAHPPTRRGVCSPHAASAPPFALRASALRVPRWLVVVTADRFRRRWPLPHQASRRSRT